MKSIFSAAGYLMNDNRASGNKLEEADILGCLHCQAAIEAQKWRVDGAFCHGCNGPICSWCDQTTNGCTGQFHFYRRLERAVEDRYRRDQNAKILGTD